MNMVIFDKLHLSTTLLLKRQAFRVQEEWKLNNNLDI